MQKRWIEINERHAERLQRMCAERGVQMMFDGAVWNFRRRGVDVSAADLRYVRDEDLVPAR